MTKRKIFNMSVPDNKEHEIDMLKIDMKKVIDLARIHNKKTNGKKLPENAAELILFGMEGVCEKLLKKLEGKITEEDVEKMENKRQYIREYYREYREKENPSKKVKKKSKSI